MKGGPLAGATSMRRITVCGPCAVAFIGENPRERAAAKARQA